MNKKIKLLISTIVLSLSFNNAQAGIMDFVSVLATKQTKDPNKTSQYVDNKEITALGLAGAVGVGLMTEAKNRAALDRFVNDRSLVKPYFKEHNDEIIPFSKYLVHTIAQPQPYEDYVKYKEFATYLGLIKLPPYAGDVKNAPVVHTQPQQENPHNGIYQNPIANTQFSNIIYTPQGEKIDTGTEFPFETPRSWKEYLLLKQDSTILGNNMIAAEQAKNPNYIKPDNVAAHHLISSTSPDTKDARDILEKYLKAITPSGEKTYNNEVNGVYLPNINNTDPNVPGILHNGRHPQDYNIKVNKMIVDADIQGGWTAVQQTLQKIKQELLNSNRSDKWKDVL